MEWIVLFILSWTIFLALIDLKYLRYSIIGSLAAAVMQVIVDNIGGNLELYRVSGGLIWFGNSSVFFTLGVPLAIGSVFIQFYPKKFWLKILNIPVCSFLFLLIEFLLVNRKVLVYNNWNSCYSYLINIFAFIVLGWAREAFLPPWPGRKEKW